MIKLTAYSPVFFGIGSGIALGLGGAYLDLANLSHNPAQRFTSIALLCCGIAAAAGALAAMRRFHQSNPNRRA
jgi:hypothetical protein